MGASAPPPAADPAASVVSPDSAPACAPADPSEPVLVAGHTGSDVGKPRVDEVAEELAAVAVAVAGAGAVAPPATAPPPPQRSWFSRWRWVLAAFAVVILGRISKL